MDYGLGVDLGTTFTAAAVRHNGHAEIARLGSRRAEIPSVVFVRSDGRVLIGEAAERRGAEEPARLAREFKRRIGDPVPLLVGGSPYPAHALMARLLEEVLGTVTRQQEGPPAAITVTYPANWGPYKRELLGQAVRLAELDNVTLRAEPEAAAVRYAASERIRPGEVVAVYDLGGGTFDAAVLRKTETGFELLGEPEGIEQLGGIDFDEAVLGHVTAALGQHVAALDPDDAGVIEALARLRRDCIEAKEALSYDTEVMVPVALPALHTRVRLNRSEFETMITPALLETVAVMRRAMRSAGVEPAQLRSILLAGGSSRIPLVSQLLSVEFGRPVVLDASPEHSIALGAALVTGGLRGPQGEASRAGLAGRDPVAVADAGVVVDPVAPQALADRSGPDDDDGTAGPDSRRRSRMAILLSKLSGRSRSEGGSAAPVSGSPASLSGAVASAVAGGADGPASSAAGTLSATAGTLSSTAGSAAPDAATPGAAGAAGTVVAGAAGSVVAGAAGTVVAGAAANTVSGPAVGFPAGPAVYTPGDPVPDTPSRGIARVPTQPPPVDPKRATGRATVPLPEAPVKGRAPVTGFPAPQAPSVPTSPPPAVPTSPPPAVPTSPPPAVASSPPAGRQSMPAMYPGSGAPPTSRPIPFGPGTGPGGPGPVAPPRAPRDHRRRLYLVAAIIAVVVALIAAGATGFLLTRDSSPLTGSQPPGGNGDAPIGRWERKADLPVPAQGAAMAAWNGNLWVAGGQRDNDDRTKFSDVYVYNTATNTWTTGPALPRPISHASLVPTPMGLFFVGGWIENGGSTQVLRLNDTGTGWEDQPPLPETRVTGVGGWTGRELVYAGGTRSGDPPTAADTVWALRNGAWVEIGRLQTPRQRLMAAGNGVDTLWIMGGRENQTNEKYGAIDIVNADGVTKSNRLLDPPIDSGAGIFLQGVGVCIVGGQTPGGGFNDWWCEESSLDDTLPRLDPPRSGLAAAMRGRTVYVVGGYGKGFNSLSWLEAFTFPT